MYKLFVIMSMIATIIFAAIFGHSIALGGDAAGGWIMLVFVFTGITGYGIFYDE